MQNRDKKKQPSKKFLERFRTIFRNPFKKAKDPTFEPIMFRHTNKTVDLYLKRKRSTKVQKFTKLLANRNAFLRIFSRINYFAVSAVTVSICLIWFGMNYLSTSKDFTLKKTNYQGLINLKPATLDGVLNEYFGKSIFNLNPSQAEEKLKKNFIEISAARIEKIYPDKLNIYIIEKVPSVTYVNLSGCYLLDDKGEVLQAKNSQQPFHLGSLEYQLARGFGNPEADYIEDRVVARLTEEELKEFKFEEYDFSKKEEILTQMNQEIVTKLDSVISEELKECSFASTFSIPVIKAWDEQQFEVGSFYDVDLVQFFGIITSRVKSDFVFPMESITWDGNYRLMVQVNDITIITFSSQRKTSEQLEDLKLVLEKENKSIDKFKQIDLSGTKVLVE